MLHLFSYTPFLFSILARSPLPTQSSIHVHPSWSSTLPCSSCFTVNTTHLKDHSLSASSSNFIHLLSPTPNVCFSQSQPVSWLPVLGYDWGFEDLMIPCCQQGWSCSLVLSASWQDTFMSSLSLALVFIRPLVNRSAHWTSKGYSTLSLLAQITTCLVIWLELPKSKKNNKVVPKKGRDSEGRDICWEKGR